MNKSAFEQQCLTVVRTVLDAYLKRDRTKIQSMVHLLAENFVFIDELHADVLNGQTALISGSEIHSYHALYAEECDLRLSVRHLSSYSCVVYGFSNALRCSCSCSLGAAAEPLLNSLHLSIPFNPSLAEECKRDSLTGLYNRQYVEKYIMHRLRSHEEPGILFMVDMDNFKYINDSLGHLAGDNILACVAQILRTVFGKDSIIGRIGGDEFLILTEGAALTGTPEETAETAIQSVST